MLSIIAAGLFALTTPHSDLSSRCTIAVDRFTAPSNAPAVVLRATRDSTLDGHYVPAGNGVRRVAPSPGVFIRPVYGQKMDLLAVEGPDAITLASAKRAVVIWWGMTPACTPYFPFTTTRIPSGEVFILARVRPEAEWVEGTPTFDVYHRDWVYAPTEYQPKSPAHSAMSMAEYRAFFRLLPTTQQQPLLARDAQRRLAAWADSNPTLAAKFPANDAVCFVRMLDGGRRDCFER